PSVDQQDRRPILPDLRDRARFDIAVWHLAWRTSEPFFQGPFDIQTYEFRRTVFVLVVSNAALIPAGQIRWSGITDDSVNMLIPKGALALSVIAGRAHPHEGGKPT